VVTSPGDPHEVGALTKFMIQHRGPCYMRLNKVGEPILNGTINSLSLGEILQIKEGEGTAVLTTGAVLPEAFNFIRSERPDYALYSFPFVSPIDKTALAKILNRFTRIMTVEEHQMNCGFGSAILEIANDLYYQGGISRMPPVQRVGIPNKFVGFAGTQEFLRREVGLSL
jgi:transketolase